MLTEHAGWGVDDLLDEAGPLRDVEVRNADNPLHNQLLMLYNTHIHTQTEMQNVHVRKIEGPMYAEHRYNNDTHV